MYAKLDSPKDSAVQLSHKLNGVFLLQSFQAFLLLLWVRFNILHWISMHDRWIMHLNFIPQSIDYFS